MEQKNEVSISKSSSEVYINETFSQDDSGAVEGDVTIFSQRVDTASNISMLNLSCLNKSQFLQVDVLNKSLMDKTNRDWQGSQSFLSDFSNPNLSGTSSSKPSQSKKQSSKQSEEKKGVIKFYKNKTDQESPPVNGSFVELINNSKETYPETSGAVIMPKMQKSKTE